MKKVLICDYTNALEPNYEPTISSMSEALGEPVECLIRPYVSDEELVQELAGADGRQNGIMLQSVISGNIARRRLPSTRLH